MLVLLLLGLFLCLLEKMVVLNSEEDTSGCQCMEESGGFDGREEDVEKVLRSRVTPAYLYGLEMVVLTEQQQRRLQVCKNNWVETGD